MAIVAQGGTKNQAKLLKIDRETGVYRQQGAIAGCPVA